MRNILIIGAGRSASCLIRYLLEKFSDLKAFHIINIEKSCDSLMNFCVKMGFMSFTEQHEMILELKED